MTTTHDPRFTQSFLNLLSTNSKEKVCLIFLQHLQHKFPVPSDITITTTFSSKKDKVIHGNVVTDTLHKTADITLVNFEQAEHLRVLSTLAHEYKHIMQAWVECPKEFQATKKNKPNMEHEIQAGVFGAMEARKFCYGW